MINTQKSRTAIWLVACGVSWLPMTLHAWEPGAKELDAAIKAGDFTGYFTNMSAWLGQKLPAAPGQITAASLQALLKDPVFINTLDQRQFIAKLGADKTAAFAKADPENAGFLAALMNNTQVMDMLLESVGPTPIPARDQNAYSIAPETLDIWK